MKQTLLSTGFVVLALSLFLLGGCQRSVNTAEPSDPRINPNILGDKRIITDRGLKGKVEVMDLREQRIEGDLLRVQVQLLNNTRKRQNVNYQFQWFDGEGMNVPTLMDNWKRLSLMGGENAWVTATAPNPRVATFQFKLVEADD